MRVKRNLEIKSYLAPTCTSLDFLSEDVLCGSWNDDEEGPEDFYPEIDDSNNWM